MERIPDPSHVDVGITQAVADLERGVDALERLLAQQRETIGLLASQLDARTREVQELHVLLLLHQAVRGHAPESPSPDALAAPAPVNDAPAEPARRGVARWWAALAARRRNCGTPR